MSSASTESMGTTVDFYRQAIDILNETQIPFQLGGAYALRTYTGITRDTKDLDVFLRPADCPRALAALAAHGYRSEFTFPHWLGKVYSGDRFVDLIFSSGNGIARVDDDWFRYARTAWVLERRVLLCPPEEMIWSKAFIMERERFDGADVAHLIRAQGHVMDWDRLRRRFTSHERLLLVHFILFGFIYPAETFRIPRTLFDDLLAKLQQETPKAATAERVCQGTLLSREQFLMDVAEWGYVDARLPPHGRMTPDAIARWTAAIGCDTPPCQPYGATPTRIAIGP